MTTAAELLRSHPRDVAALGSGASVLEAAQLMNSQHIGSVLVVDADKVTGIFTERDVLRRVVVAGLDPAETMLRDVMTRVVACAAPDTTLNEIRHVMREQHIRHVPVVGEDSILGMISIGDLNEVQSEIQEQTIAYLERYVSVL